MTVNQIVGFVKKYNLSGNGAEQILIKSEEGVGTYAEFHDSQKILVGRVVMTDELPIENVAIYSTKGFTSMLSALNPEADLVWDTEVNPNGIVTKLIVSDGRAKVHIACADPAVIPDVRGLKQIPDWDVVFQPSQDLIKRMVKYQSATGAEATAFKVEGGELTIVTNHSAINANKITTIVDSEMIESCTDESFTLAFFAPLMVSIFANNLDSEIIVRISKRGILNIEAQNAGFESDYKMKPRIV
jgi:hypothetical protein